MTATEVQEASLRGGELKALPRPLLRVGALVVLSGLLALLVTVVAPGLPRLVGIERDIARLQDKDIRAGAYYYTEMKEIPGIEARVGAAMRSGAVREAAARAAAGGE